MTFARLVVRDLFRNPLRTGLTVLAGAVGVLAFVFLQTVVDLFYLGAESAQVDRLIVRNKAGFTQPLPLAYRDRIAAVPGVSAVTFSGWFGGRISERRKEQFANFYVDSATYLEVYDEYTAPPEQIAAWKQDPCGAVVGDELAERFGWEVGDRVVLQGSIFPGEWPLTIRGIFGSTRPGGDTNVLAFGYPCVNEKIPEDQQNQVGIYSVLVEDPSRSPQVAAQIDAMFANSPYETRTESERAFQLGFVAMTSAILVAVQTVSFVILVIILLVVANTLALGVREKTVDFATLKAIGFRKRHVLSMVVWEALVIGGLAAGIGIAAAPLVVQGFIGAVEDQFGGFPEVTLQPGTLIFSAVMSVGVALIAALAPALRAARLSVVEGLRKVA